MHFKEKAIPWLFLICGGVCVGIGLVYGVVTEDVNWYEPVLGMVPGVILLVIARVTGKMGYGDGIILMMIGCVTTYWGGCVVLCLSSFLAAVFCVVLLAFRKVKRHSRIPYVPFLTGAYCIYIFMFR